MSAKIDLKGKGRKLEIGYVTEPLVSAAWELWAPGTTRSCQAGKNVGMDLWVQCQVDRKGAESKGKVRQVDAQDRCQGR